MQKRLAACAAFLLVIAWQYRRIRPVLFVIVATQFAVGALFAAGLPVPAGWILRLLVVAWLIGVLAAGDVFSGEADLHLAKKHAEIVI
jgi:hypothetical protein